MRLKGTAVVDRAGFEHPQFYRSFPRFMRLVALLTLNLTLKVIWNNISTYCEHFAPIAQRNCTS